jgi:hypothetical protein
MEGRGSLRPLSLNGPHSTALSLPKLKENYLQSYPSCYFYSFVQQVFPLRLIQNPLLTGFSMKNDCRPLSKWL